MSVIKKFRITKIKNSKPLVSLKKISLSFKSESMLWKLYNCDYRRPKVNDKFDSVWSNNLGKTQHVVEMEKNLENSDFGLNDANVKNPEEKYWQCH